MKPLLIAHRGDTYHFPENTIEAFNSAFNLGADGIEMDIQLRDGKLIVVHDYMYNKNKLYPFLEDVLSAITGKGRIEIEIKSFQREIIPILVNVINSFPNEDFEFTSSVLPILPLVEKELPNKRLGMILPNYMFEKWMDNEMIKQMLKGYLDLTRSDVLHLPIDYVDKEIVDFLHINNFIVHTHLVSDSKQEYNKIVEIGVDQATFDDINLLDDL